MTQKKPVSTWNGKRGVVIDIVCVWVCSACTSGSLSSWGASFLLNFDYIFSLGRGLPFTLMFIATGLHLGCILKQFSLHICAILAHFRSIWAPFWCPEHSSEGHFLDPKTHLFFYRFFNTFHPLGDKFYDF